MLYATGLELGDMAKPQVGIASVWFEGNPCDMHLLSLAEKVKEGTAAAGLVGLRFNTIGVSDGISMGTRGMSFSLQSRDLIADSIENANIHFQTGQNQAIRGRGPARLYIVDEAFRVSLGTKARRAARPGCCAEDLDEIRVLRNDASFTDPFRSSRRDPLLLFRLRLARHSDRPDGGVNDARSQDRQ